MCSAHTSVVNGGSGSGHGFWSVDFEEDWLFSVPDSSPFLASAHKVPSVSYTTAIEVELGPISRDISHNFRGPRRSCVLAPSFAFLRTGAGLRGGRPYQPRETDSSF